MMHSQINFDNQKLTGRGGTGQLLQEVLMTDAENNNFQMRHLMNSSASTKTVGMSCVFFHVFPFCFLPHADSMSCVFFACVPWIHH